MDNSAFPFIRTGETGEEEGLTKREWFAGMAMQGILASSPKYEFSGKVVGQTDAEELAADSYAYADAMIKESQS